MKFIKLILLLTLSLFVLSACSDNNSGSNSGSGSSTTSDLDGATINFDKGIVTDENGVIIGNYDSTTGDITDTSGNVIGNYDSSTGEITNASGDVIGNVDPETGTITGTGGSSDDGNEDPTNPSNPTDLSEYSIDLNGLSSTISLNLKEEITSGNTQTITPTFTAKDSDGNNVSYTVEYTNSDDTVISLVEGGNNSAVITALSEGEATVTIALRVNGNTEDEATITVIVSDEYTANSFDTDLKNAFVAEFTTHFSAREIAKDTPNTITADEGSDTYNNIVYILVALANQGVGSPNNENLAAAYGRIVAEEVSDTTTGSCDNVYSLGCVLISYLHSMTATDFKSSLDGFLNSETGGDYYTTFSSIATTLANLNSQRNNIIELADILESAVNVAVETQAQARVEQSIKNQLSYATSYMAYTALRMYCATNTSECRTGNDVVEGSSFDLYMPNTSESGLVFYCENKFNGDGACSNNDPTEYQLDPSGVKAAEAFVNADGSGYSWTISSEDYTTYIKLFDQVGYAFQTACEDIVDYGNEYMSESYNFTDSCTYTAATSTGVSDAISGVKSIATATYNAASATDVSELSTVANIANDTSAKVSDSDTASAIASNVLDSAYTVYTTYYSTLLESGEITVNATGKRNIYYFISEFINGLDTDNYLSGYTINTGYSANTLPANSEVEPLDGTNFYTALSSGFMDTTSGDAISIDTLNTTDDTGASSTAGFTSGEDGIVQDILTNTQDTVLEVLSTYGVITQNP